MDNNETIERLEREIRLTEELIKLKAVLVELERELSRIYTEAYWDNQYTSFSVIRKEDIN